MAWKPRSYGFLAGIDGNIWLWPAKIPGQANANAVWSQPKPKPSQKAKAFWPEAKARTSLAIPFPLTQCGRSTSLLASEDLHSGRSMKIDALDAAAPRLGCLVLASACQASSFEGARRRDEARPPASRLPQLIEVFSIDNHAAMGRE